MLGPQGLHFSLDRGGFTGAPARARATQRGPQERGERSRKLAPFAMPT
jgi:hypothetical protein